MPEILLGVVVLLLLLFAAGGAMTTYLHNLGPLKWAALFLS
jgi:hypothetical protein